jgi:hypothetical protein
MTWKTSAGPAGAALDQPEELDRPFLGAMLTAPAARGLLGDGPINLFCARREVHEVLRAAGGRVPLAPPLKDALLARSVPSFASGRTEDRVLAEIDQDGFAFAVDPLDVQFFNRRAERRERQQNLLDIVLFDGQVCIRKRFRGLRPGAIRWGSKAVPLRQRAIRGLWAWMRLFLYSEAAALFRLQDLPYVPKVRHIDFADHALYIDCLVGESLRHRAARSGAAVHDNDLATDGDLAGLTGRELDRREVGLLDGIGGGDFRSEIATMTAEINSRGVAPLDIKLGNFFRGATSGTLYWLDFEISRIQSQPRWEADLAAQTAILEELFQLEDHRAQLLHEAAAKTA